MRATTLATTVLIALAMSATPAPAADRTAQTLDEDLELATLTAWIAEVEQTYLGYVLPGTAGLISWTPLPLPVDKDTATGETTEVSKKDRRSRVILEDGAPF